MNSHDLSWVLILMNFPRMRRRKMECDRGMDVSEDGHILITRERLWAKDSWRVDLVWRDTSPTTF